MPARGATQPPGLGAGGAGQPSAPETAGKGEELVGASGSKTAMDEAPDAAE